MRKVRVAIVGAGNCANAFLQGLEYYKQVTDHPLAGLVRPYVGPYHVSDIEVVAAFDVIEGKVGQNLYEAAWAFPNDTLRFSGMPAWAHEVIVQRGPTHDGLGQYLSKILKASEIPVVDVVNVLTEAQVDVVVNYLPVGSQQAGEAYAAFTIAAGCSLVNCMPVFIASDTNWAERFRINHLPIIGDDIKSQVGATIVHRVLASLFHDRGVKLTRTYQLNIGGNSDFLNMLERERLISKKISKTESVISVSGTPIEGPNVHIGPSDYVQWLGDRKIAYIRLEGEGFGGVPLMLEAKLEVWDSHNSAGIVIDAVRCAKLAMDRGLSGPMEAASAYFMKHPAKQINDDVAHDLLEAFIRG